MPEPEQHDSAMMGILDGGLTHSVIDFKGLKSQRIHTVNVEIL